MDIRKLTETLSVSPQITTEDIPAIRQAGFRAIICNRPDAEGPDQPDFADIAKAAETAGIKARYIPVQTGMISDKDVSDFGAALADLPQPTLAFCRSGTRSATLWSLHESKHRPLPEILAATMAAGYDMSPLADRLANTG